MTEKKTGTARLITLLLIMLLASLVWTAAQADDAEQLKLLPGRWTFTDEVQEDEAEPAREIQAVLTLGEDGRMSLQCAGGSGGSYTCEGAWASAFMPDGMDRLMLIFTSTSDPRHAESGYRVECNYAFYTESWVENDTEYTALILEDAGSSGVSPFEEFAGYSDVALERKREPNMQVVKCREFVSLRQTRSTSSARLAKVPLGAPVLAFPEYGEENGFLWCVYHDEFGYILAEYLQPLE